MLLHVLFSYEGNGQINRFACLTGRTGLQAESFTKQLQRASHMWVMLGLSHPQKRFEFLLSLPDAACRGNQLQQAATQAISGPVQRSLQDLQPCSRPTSCSVLSYL